MTVTVVAGPPAAGKTTFVEQHAKPGDLVIDLDAIAGGHDRTAAQTTAALAEMAALEEMAPDYPGDVWVIRCAPNPKDRRTLAAKVGATRTVVIATPEERAIAQAVQDGRPEQWPDLVAAWWDSFVPDDDDEILAPTWGATHPTWEPISMPDDPTPDPAPEPDPATDPLAEPPAPAADDELAKWKAMARKHEAQAKANADAAKRLAEIEEANKTEAERLADAARAAEERAGNAEKALARLKVAQQHGLPAELAERLVGSTEEEMAEDAARLLAVMQPTTPPTPPTPTGSADNGPQGSTSGKPKQLSRADLAGMTPEAILEAKAKGQLDDVLGIS